MIMVWLCLVFHILLLNQFPVLLACDYHYHHTAHTTIWRMCVGKNAFHFYKWFGWCHRSSFDVRQYYAHKARFEIPQMPWRMYCCIADFGPISRLNSQAPAIAWPVELKPDRSTELSNAEIYRAKTIGLKWMRLSAHAIPIARVSEKANCAREMQLSGVFKRNSRRIISVGTLFILICLQRICFCTLFSGESASCNLCR